MPIENRAELVYRFQSALAQLHGIMNKLETGQFAETLLGLCLLQQALTKIKVLLVKQQVEGSIQKIRNTRNEEMRLLEAQRLLEIYGAILH